MTWIPQSRPECEIHVVQRMSCQLPACNLTSVLRCLLPTSFQSTYYLQLDVAVCTLVAMQMQEPINNREITGYNMNTYEILCLCMQAPCVKQHTNCIKAYWAPTGKFGLLRLSVIVMQFLAIAYTYVWCHRGLAYSWDHTFSRRISNIYHCLKYVMLTKCRSTSERLHNTTLLTARWQTTVCTSIG